MAKKNSIRTHSDVASKASDLLRKARSKKVQSVAGSDLVNRMKKTSRKK